MQANIELALYKHKIEKELKDSKEWFSTTLKCIGDAVIAVDLNGIVVFMNPAAQLLTGWDMKDGVGKKLNDIYNIVNVETEEQIETHIKNSTQDVFRFDQVFQKLLIDKYGIKVPVEDKYRPITDINENIIGSVLVFRDTID